MKKTNWNLCMGILTRWQPSTLKYLTSWNTHKIINMWWHVHMLSWAWQPPASSFCILGVVKLVVEASIQQHYPGVPSREHASPQVADGRPIECDGSAPSRANHKPPNTRDSWSSFDLPSLLEVGRVGVLLEDVLSKVLLWDDLSQGMAQV